METLPTITQEDVELIMELSIIPSMIMPDEYKKVIALRDKLQGLIDYSSATDDSMYDDDDDGGSYYDDDDGDDWRYDDDEYD